MKTRSTIMTSVAGMFLGAFVSISLLQFLPAAADGFGGKGGRGGRGPSKDMGPEAVYLCVAVESEDSAFPFDIIIDETADSSKFKGQNQSASSGEEAGRGKIIIFDRPLPLKIKKFSPDAIEAEIIKMEKRGEGASPEESAKPSFFKIGEISLALPKAAGKMGREGGAPGDEDGNGDTGSGQDGRGEGLGGARRMKGMLTAGLAGKLKIKTGEMEIDSKEATYTIYGRRVRDSRD